MADTLHAIVREYEALVTGHFSKEIRALKGASIDTLTYCEDVADSREARLIVPKRLGKVSALRNRLMRFLDEHETFWKRNRAVVARCVSRLAGLKLGVFSGVEAGDIARLALYHDTILLFDPIQGFIADSVRSKRGSEATVLAQLVYWAQRIDKLRPLIHAQSQHPIIVVVPHEGRTVVTAEEYLRGSQSPEIQAVLTLSHAYIADAFGVSIDKYDPAAIARIMSGSSNANLIAAGEKMAPLLLAIRDAVRSGGLPMSAQSGVGEHSLAAAAQGNRQSIIQAIPTIVGMFGVFLNREANALRCQAISDFDPLSWSVFESRNSFLANRYQTQLNAPDHVVYKYAFQSRLRWLENLSIQDVAGIREGGDLEEVRRIFRHSGCHLQVCCLQEFEQAARAFEQSVNDQFQQMTAHESAILSDLRRRTRNSWLSFGATVALSAGSFALPELVPLAVASTALSATWGTASLKDVVNAHVSGRKETDRFRSRPIGMLLQAWNADRQSPV
jgi:hypothetical protein